MGLKTRRKGKKSSSSKASSSSVPTGRKGSKTSPHDPSTPRSSIFEVGENVNDLSLKEESASSSLNENVEVTPIPTEPSVHPNAPIHGLSLHSSLQVNQSKWTGLAFSLPSLPGI